MCNALTVTKRESAPLPERLCERIAYCAILLTVYEADYSVVVAQSEGADHRYYSTPEMQNILLQNVVGHAVRKAKNFAGSATDTIFSGRQVLINLAWIYVQHCNYSDFKLNVTLPISLEVWSRLTSISPFCSPATKKYKSVNAAVISNHFLGIYILDFTLNHQPFGTMPRCCNSLRSTRLIQVANEVSPSALAASSSCALNSSGSRIWYGGDRFSNGVDMVITLNYYSYMVITIVLTITQKTTPWTAVTVPGRLTKPLNEVTIMAGTQHTQTHPKFIYTFLAVHRDCIADGKNTVHVAADTLVDACEMLNDMGYISATWKGREENTLFIQKDTVSEMWPERTLEMTWGEFWKAVKARDGKIPAPVTDDDIQQRVQDAAGELGWEVHFLDDGAICLEDDEGQHYFEKYNLRGNARLAIRMLRCELCYVAGDYPDELESWSEAGLNALAEWEKSGHQ